MITDAPRELPGPGIYDGLSVEAYDAIPALRSSYLKTLATKTPAHLRHQMANPLDTPALRRGNAVHTAVLEPLKFDAAYTVAQQCSQMTGKGTQCSRNGVEGWNGVWLCSQHGGRDLAGGATILTPEELIQYQKMSLAVHDHPVAAGFLDGAKKEVTGVWFDEESDLWCKLRADLLSPEKLMLGDLKTTTDASRDEFERSVIKYGYHTQAAFYLRGLAKLGIPIEDVCHIVVEDAAPHVVNFFRLTDELIAFGGSLLPELMASYAECLRSNQWPAYAGVNEIGIPAWLERKLQFEGIL